MISKYLNKVPNIADFEQKGFLVISLHDEVINIINSIFETGERFYKNVNDIKLKNSIPELNEGWKDLGGEFSITPDVPDLHESFWVTQKNKLLALSKYTNEGRELYLKMDKCISMYNEIERTITTSLMQYLGIKDYQNPKFNCDGYSDMQILHYQPFMHTREHLQEPHDDSLYMTFAKATRQGLEILLDDNLFHKAELAKNEILVMPGEILSLMTGYRIKPLIHQVLNHKDQKDRYSLCYFTYPDIIKGQKLEAWIKNDSNENIDIMEKIIINQSQYLTK